MAKILLIDDDPRIQQTYTKFLRSEGYEVFQAMSAEEATEILLSRSIDLILLDINMPEIDGTVMKEVIDAFEGRARVVISSVYPLAEQRRRIFRADDYFDKSHGVDWLRVIIRRVLGNDVSAFSSGIPQERRG